MVLNRVASRLSVNRGYSDTRRERFWKFYHLNPVMGVNNMHPTLFGEVFANFGKYWFIFAIFWSGFVSAFNRFKF